MIVKYIKVVLHELVGLVCCRSTCIVHQNIDAVWKQANQLRPKILDVSQVAEVSGYEVGTNAKPVDSQPKHEDSMCD